MALSLADGFDLFEQPLVVQAVGDDHGLRVIGDAEVLQAEFHGFLRHFLEGAEAVGGGGVVVEGAAEVVEFDEAGERVFGGGFDFAAVLAEFGLDEFEAERLIDVALPRGGRRGCRPWNPVLG